MPGDEPPQQVELRILPRPLELQGLRAGPQLARLRLEVLDLRLRTRFGVCSLMVALATLTGRGEARVR